MDPAVLTAKQPLHDCCECHCIPTPPQALHPRHPPHSADSNHCPHFLPRCKGVILCSTLKAGMGLGLELGTGLLLARLPPSPPPTLPASASSKSVEAWSPKSSSSMGFPSPWELLTAGAGGGEATPASPLASPAALPASPSCIARASRWSAPCFVTVGALSAGEQRPAEP